MSTEKTAEPNTAETAPSQSTNSALWPSFFILFLLINFLLPRSWSDVFSASVMTGLAAFVAAMITWYWVARRRSGRVLRNLGNVERVTSAQLVLSFGIAFVALYNYFAYHSQDVSRLAQSIMWLTVAVAAVIANRQPTLITAKGWYKVGASVSWENIDYVEWEDMRKGFAVLVLQFKRKRWWLRSARFRIPATEVTAVEELLFQNGTAQHGVQPTRPAAKVEHPF